MSRRVMLQVAWRDFRDNRTDVSRFMQWESDAGFSSESPLINH